MRYGWGIILWFDNGKFMSSTYIKNYILLLFCKGTIRYLKKKILVTNQYVYWLSLFISVAFTQTTKTLYWGAYGLLHYLLSTWGCFWLDVENLSKSPGSENTKVPSHSCASEWSAVKEHLNQETLQT